MSKQFASIMKLTQDEKRKLNNARCADPIGILRERDNLRVELAQLRADLHEAAELLRYVAYQRLPLGDTVFDHLDFERQKHIDSFLAKLKGDS